MVVESFNFTIYNGDTHLTEVNIANICPQSEDSDFLNAVKEVIKISPLSPASERCPALAVLHTITSSRGFIKVVFKEQHPQSEQPPLKQLYNTCLKETKVHFILHH